MGQNFRLRQTRNTLYDIIFLFHKIIQWVRTMLKNKFGAVWSSGSDFEKRGPHPTYKVYDITEKFAAYYTLEKLESLKKVFKNLSRDIVEKFQVYPDTLQRKFMSEITENRPALFLIL